MGRDIRLALRRLGATPLFTTFAILSLAVGVAITTAVYSIVDAVFLRGLGIHEPDRVAVIVTPYSGRLLTGTVSEPDFRDVQTAQTSFSHVAASARAPAASVGLPAPSLLHGPGRRHRWPSSIEK